MPPGCRLLILDAYSTDKTAEIARAHGAVVIEREWRGFIDARVFALSAVQTPWTFMVDADEELDRTLRDAILACDASADGYRISRTTYFCGRPMRIWSGEHILRLFRTDRATLRSRGMTETAQVHEVWSVRGVAADLPGMLAHRSYPTKSSYRAKYERYTELEAAALRPTRSRIFIEDLNAWLRFLYLLFARGALLDGSCGVFAAWWSARYRAVVFRKALQKS